MNKNLVLTIATGSDYEKISELTLSSIENYAHRIGADFKCIKEFGTSSPHWEKFQIYDLLNQYDRIIYLDTDLIVRDDCPSLFDIVPFDRLGMFNEGPFTEREFSLADSCREYGIKLSKWDGKYYNTGVMVISCCHKQLFKKPEKEFSSFYEQGYLNAVIAKENDKLREGPLMHDLNYRFNRMSCMDVFTGEERHASFIIHYAGYHYHYGLHNMLSLVKNDLDKWEKDAPAYKYKRHILIDVQGGLGDQVCAQPAIRHMKEFIYPGDDISIKTHFPELFRDMGLPVCHHDEWKSQKDTPYYRIITLPGPETVTWSVVSNLLCHTVDYCSIALFKKTLPLKDKSFIYTVKEDELTELEKMTNGADLSEYVLFHAGRHWESKTFPNAWWQEVADGLAKKGVKLLFVGSDEPTRGIVPITAPKGSIDLRNRTDFTTFVAAISKCVITLSNDSSPIHLAGAFDNWIVMIPSCKHPDHVFPYRKESTRYKTYSIYKKLTIDDCDQRPTAIVDGGSSGEKIKNDWSHYLPSPEEVVDKVSYLYGQCLGNKQAGERSNQEISK